MKRIITISREHCTGGLEIARQVAKELDIPFYDKELIRLAAKESGLSEESIAAVEKRHSTSLLYSLYTMGSELPLNDQVYMIQARIIEDLAHHSPCVIVGRCADYVLRNRSDVLRVFIHAPMEYRKQYAVEHGLFAKDAESRIVEMSIAKEDKRRAGYYNYYTQNRWGEARYYDLCLNAQLGQDVCAALIEKAAKGQ
ncbi:MAG: cytidylate kinase-like family protein [Candidatus Fournierella pullistercoris]|uniref:Cytidylate kinase-like family protein n=1 Tax=Candidatus Allofournierella pullistercoris TaxID=2838597 RepID=A0A948T305_9FIRM|nr:cytidylate kinase-like family protein [Candidatus Fournierella pullistercoris]